MPEFNGLKTLSCIVGIPAAAVGLFVFILIATKESCPFVYAYADGEYVFRGEIFSGAVFPSEERDDYLLIPGITGIEGEYRIKIINKIRNEDQYNNFSELILYDHPPDVSIIVDKYGNPHTIKNPVSPSNAKNRYEQEIRPSLVSKNDDIIYQSGIVNKTDLKDEIICTFPRPQGKEKAKLVIRAKNTFWLDYVYKEFFYQLGDYYPQWYENRMKKKENDFELNKARGFFLSVYIKNSGEWHYADSFSLVGPVAFRDDALELDLSHIPCPDDILTIKLEAGMNFWEIDYLALDYSDNMPLTGTVVPLAGAVNQSGEDVSSMLKEKDTSYYFQPDYNDQALIRFPVPPAIPGLQRTVVLHTCGYYLIDIGPAPRGKPRKKDLLKLKDPDEFLKFSNR